eukprot:CAMPEP_0203812190 /NCGR_PEP_ID=MMETSP0115-20131106/4007_1 /ASSEMBLY_ACC=CAM_ASM_000227 /TAXON_ID=33651 /ORGANISM="Bicosoecid sp, Strain ms1" /LENGTH=507 /DNA_ID=CAMNT_0050721029 /DNA_START=36 /DNA_END=1555 /DNA_ORIENTATION=+
MAERALREFDAKNIVSRYITKYTDDLHSGLSEIAQVSLGGSDAASAASAATGGAGGDGATARPPKALIDEELRRLEKENPWLLTNRLVVKPDVLIKRRGKGGLLLLDKTWDEAKPWIAERLGSTVEVEDVKGKLTHMLVEPFLVHADEQELYLCIQSNREGEEILFYHRGGVDVGDVDKKALRLQVGIDDDVHQGLVVDKLLAELPSVQRTNVASFIVGLFNLYRALHFVYLEINPLVLQADGKCTPLDMAAKLDEAAHYLVHEMWGDDLDFPPPFGASLSPEEALIHDLDAKTGASLKLTLLNPAGRVWTMVAGGGASVVYADTIADLGAGHELANYGEYSGAPSEELTYQYARTILRLMTRGEPREDGKVLIIGGGIANFTDVKKTFKGIIRALRENADALRRHHVKAWVRRGGPNYQEGLEAMKNLGKQIGLKIEVYGPETHITAIVPMALGLPVDDELLGKYELATPALPVTEAAAAGGAGGDDAEHSGVARARSGSGSSSPG